MIDGGSPALGSDDAIARLAFVRAVMKDQAHRANLWMTGWSATGFAIAAGEFALVPFVNDDRRAEEAVAGMSSFYIPASIAVLPAACPGERGRLSRATPITDAPVDTALPCLVLARAEALPRRYAATDEARQHRGLSARALRHRAACGRIPPRRCRRSFAIHSAATLVNGVGTRSSSARRRSSPCHGGRMHRGLEQYRRGVTLADRAGVRFTLVDDRADAGGSGGGGRRRVLNDRSRMHVERVLVARGGEACKPPLAQSAALDAEEARRTRRFGHPTPVVHVVVSSPFFTLSWQVGVAQAPSMRNAC